MAGSLRRSGVENLFSVLGGDNNGIHTKRMMVCTTIFLVLDGDLSLRVRGGAKGRAPERRATAIAALSLCARHNGQWHALLGLVGRIAKHDALISRTMVLKASMVQSSCNVGRLLLDGNEDVAGLVIKALLRVVVTNLLDRVTDDFLVINLGLCGDLSKDHDHASLRGSLTRNLGGGILLKASVELCNNALN